MSDVKVYNGDEVDIAWGPVIIEGGRADGEFLRIAAAENITDSVAGTDGEVAVSRLNNKQHEITVILMQTSEHNDMFSTLFNLAKSAPGMVGAIHPFVARDKNGRAIFEAANAWPLSYPEASYDRTATSREWILRCNDIDRFDGGN